MWSVSRSRFGISIIALLICSFTIFSFKNDLKKRDAGFNKPSLQLSSSEDKANENSNIEKDTSMLNNLLELVSVVNFYIASENSAPWCIKGSKTNCEKLNEAKLIPNLKYLPDNLEKTGEMRKGVKAVLGSIVFEAKNNSTKTYALCFQPVSKKYQSDIKTEYKLVNNNLNKGCDKSKEQCWYCYNSE